MIRIIERDPGAHDSAYEVLADGQRYVSLQLFDATGDNALVYLTRSQALKLAERLAGAANDLPKRAPR